MGLSAAEASLHGPRGAWPLVRPAGEVTAFAVLFLVVSLVVAAPFSLMTGRTVLGIGYILPFTLAFVWAYQRLAHREGLRELGLDPRAPSLRLTAAGFLGCGLGALAIQSVHLETGWMEVRAVNVVALTPEAVAGGLALALALNFGIGLGEELVFRGYVLRRLRLGYRKGAAPVLLSSLFYSAAHLPRGDDPLVLLNLFLLGVVLALAVLLTGSLWASVGVHMGWDFWSDGVYFFRLPGPRAARVLSYAYHLDGWDDLLAFKLVSSLALVAAAGGLALCMRRARARLVLTEENR